ncbi:MAG: hypothetical protein HZR80_14095 [Candidatus Heimdallarchaeota archaeon]
MNNVEPVYLFNNDIDMICVECGTKIDKQNILDPDKPQFCFYCNRKKIQRF